MGKLIKYILISVLCVSHISAIADTNIEREAYISKIQTRLHSVSFESTSIDNTQKLVNAMMDDASLTFKNCKNRRNITKCLRNKILSSLKEAKHSKRLGKIEKKLIKKIVKTVRKTEGSWTFAHDNRVPTANLISYIQNKNHFEALRNSRVRNKDKDLKVLSIFNKYYSRNILGLGRIDAVDYLYFHYKKEQVLFLTDIFKEVTQMDNSKKAQLIYYKKHGAEDELYSIDKRKLDKLLGQLSDSSSQVIINKLDKKIQSVSKRLVTYEVSDWKVLQARKAKKRAKYDELVMSVIKESSSSNRLEIYEKLTQIKNDLEDMAIEEESYLKTIEISGYNRARFALAYLEYELKKHNVNGMLVNKFADVGDAVMANYLSGKLDESFTLSLLDNRGYQEGFVPKWKKLGNATLYALNQGATFIPVAGQLIQVGYIIYTSLRNISINKKEQVNEAHYF